MEYNKYVRCQGVCIKPCYDITEMYFKTIKECREYIKNCYKRKHGYKCEAEVFEVYYTEEKHIKAIVRMRK